MIFDGRALAVAWQSRLKQVLAGRKSALAVVLVGEDPASQSFVKIKQKFGEAIGVEVAVQEYDEVITTKELIEIIEKLNNNSHFAGIVVQLPLPRQIDTDQVIAAINPAKDVDALGLESSFTSPTALALAEILKIAGMDPAGRRALVIGQGRLVGRPAAVYLAQAGAAVVLANQNTVDLEAKCLTADIVVTGAGRAGLVTPDMIKSGAVLIDFGTSRGKDGKLAGDIDPAAADRASLFTPTPGGTGPVTVAMLFANLAGVV